MYVIVGLNEEIASPSRAAAWQQSGNNTVMTQWYYKEKKVELNI